MKKATITVIVVAVLAVGGILVFAQKAAFGGRGGKMGGHGSGMAFHQLNLTDEQKGQVKQIMEASKEKMRPVFESLKANHDKLKEATNSGAFDEAAVTAIANEQGSLQAKMIVERERAKAQVYALLTDEQKAKFNEMKDKRWEGRKGFGHRGGHHNKQGVPGEASPME